MKRFVIKVLLTIIIPVFLLLAAYEWAMRSIPNGFSYKSELWENNVSGIKVLILGSSHTFHGFDPSCFDKKAFNAALSSQTYNYDWFIFDKYFDRMDSLEYVIVPLSSFSPFGKLEDGDEAWRSSYYSIYFNCDIHKWYEIKYRYFFPYISVDNIQRVKSYFIDKSFNNNSGMDINGYLIKTIDDRIDDFDKDGLTAARRHSVNKIDKKTKIWNENFGYMKDIITRCEKRGIRVIIVTTPTLPEYYTHLCQEQINAMVYFGNQLEQYDNVKYLNLLESPLFNNDDFCNSDHLLDKGARKLSLMVNDTIKAWDNDTIIKRN